MRSRNFRVTQNAKVLAAGDSITGAVSSTTPERLYRIQLRQHSSLNLSLSGLQANANLELLNRQGRVLSRSSQPGRSAESIHHDLTPGTYFVRVSRQQGRTRYQLRLTQDADQLSRVDIPLVIPQAPDPIAQAVVNVTNQYRLQAGLLPLNWNSRLSAAAIVHSQDMAQNDFFSHRGSDRSSLFDRLDRVGYGYDIASENIAAGYATPENVVQAWMESPGHRANILNPALTDMGVGFFLMDQDPGTVRARFYWTQNFGTPA